MPDIASKHWIEAERSWRLATGMGAEAIPLKMCERRFSGNAVKPGNDLHGRNLAVARCGRVRTGSFRASCSGKPTSVDDPASIVPDQGRVRTCGSCRRDCAGHNESINRVTPNIETGRCRGPNGGYKLTVQGILASLSSIADLGQTSMATWSVRVGATSASGRVVLGQMGAACCPCVLDHSATLRVATRCAFTIAADRHRSGTGQSVRPAGIGGEGLAAESHHCAHQGDAQVETVFHGVPFIVIRAV